MPAPLGNEFWKLGGHPGRPKLYTPETLWEKAEDYFEWSQENPLNESKPFGTGYAAIVPHPRPFTETGFRIFANISNATWQNYCNGSEEYKDFLLVTTRIKEIIFTQKFEGAATGFYNANIIARDLGLTDKSDITSNGEAIKITLDLTKG